jgi:hypothetical protein
MMTISKPIEIETTTYRLRLEGSVLTITPILVHIEPGERTLRELGPEVQRMASRGNDNPDEWSWAIVADLMRELAK